MAKPRSVRSLETRARPLVGTNDLLVSDLIRTGEKQVWFLSEHLVDAPTVRADWD